MPLRSEALSVKCTLQLYVELNAVFAVHQSSIDVLLSDGHTGVVVEDELRQDLVDCSPQDWVSFKENEFQRVVITAGFNGELLERGDPGPEVATSEVPPPRRQWRLQPRKREVVRR